MEEGPESAPVDPAEGARTEAGPNAGHLSIADGREHRLHPDSVIVARTAGFLTLTVIAAPLLLAVALVVTFASMPGAVKVAIVSGWVAGAVGGALGSQFWPALSHAHISYRVDGIGFTIRRGVLWQVATSIPKARVQHTDVSQGPLQRRYGLATLIIHTAGTQDASVSLSGLPHGTALEIRDFLIEGDDRDGV